MVIVSVIAHSVVVSMSAALRPSTEIAGPLEVELATEFDAEGLVVDWDESVFFFSDMLSEELRF
jgi:hypothetical protein